MGAFTAIFEAKAADVTTPKGWAELMAYAVGTTTTLHVLPPQVTDETILPRQYLDLLKTQLELLKSVYPNEPAKQLAGDELMTRLRADAAKRTAEQQPEGETDIAKRTRVGGSSSA